MATITNCHAIDATATVRPVMPCVVIGLQRLQPCDPSFASPQARNFAMELAGVRA